MQRYSQLEIRIFPLEIMIFYLEITPGTRLKSDISPLNSW